MSGRFDAVVIGAGPAGEVAVSRLAGQGLKTALVEREMVGGECGYWGCIPSKTLLRPVETVAEAKRTPGLSEPQKSWDEIIDYRNYMIRNLDDSGAVEGYEKSGVKVLKGEASIVGPGAIEVGGRSIGADRIVIATGSETVIPPVTGLDATGYWTNREATNFSEIPKDVAILGGGPVGIELGQMLSRYGAAVTIVQAPSRLINREGPEIGELIEAALREDGIDLRLGVRAVAARSEGSRRVLELEDGDSIEAEQLVIATGRRPRTRRLGLDTLGIELGANGEVPVDHRCRAAENVWAAGDVTGISLFTHVGKYQARIIADDVAQRDPRADYRAIPRVVFSDPEIAAVGLTREQAKEQGIELAEGSADLMSIARTETYGRGINGQMGVLADRKRRVLVGAWAVGPLASEWIHQAVLAVKAEVPIDVLRDTVAQFPTFSEAYLNAVEDLDL